MLHFHILLRYFLPARGRTLHIIPLVYSTNRKRISVYPTPFIIPDVSLTDTSFWYSRHRKPFPGSKQMDLLYLAYPPLKLAEVGKSYQHENIMNKENNVKDNDE